MAEGSKNKSDGDVDLWGAEGNPSIKSAAQRLEQDLTSCKKLDKQLHNSNLDCHYLHVENTMLWVSRCCEGMHKWLTGAYLVEKRLEKMRDKNPNRKNAFQFALGKIYTISTEVENCMN